MCTLPTQYFLAHKTANFKRPIISKQCYDTITMGQLICSLYLCISWASQCQTQVADECQRQAKRLTSNTFAWHQTTLFWWILCFLHFSPNWAFLSLLKHKQYKKCLTSMKSVQCQAKMFDVKVQMNTISTSVFDAIKHQTQAADELT